ncbi:MAG: hypothetical protein LBF04_02810 [Prevotellaceae bacterium]|nr:hypothetical protein [Prevotellaceae bacterium]
MKARINAPAIKLNPHMDGIPNIIIGNPIKKPNKFVLIIRDIMQIIENVGIIFNMNELNALRKIILQYPPLLIYNCSSVPSVLSPIMPCVIEVKLVCIISHKTKGPSTTSLLFPCVAIAMKVSGINNIPKNITDINIMLAIVLALYLHKYKNSFLKIVLSSNI